MLLVDLLLGIDDDLDAKRAVRPHHAPFFERSKRIELELIEGRRPD